MRQPQRIAGDFLDCVMCPTAALARAVRMIDWGDSRCGWYLVKSMVRVQKENNYDLDPASPALVVFCPRCSKSIASLLPGAFGRGDDAMPVKRAEQWHQCGSAQCVYEGGLRHSSQYQG